jgi:hypothetical protein
MWFNCCRAKSSAILLLLVKFSDRVENAAV